MAWVWTLGRSAAIEGLGDRPVGRPGERESEEVEEEVERGARNGPDKQSWRRDEARNEGAGAFTSAR